jgi:hypothetical protein
MGILPMPAVFSVSSRVGERNSEDMGGTPMGLMGKMPMLLKGKVLNPCPKEVKVAETGPQGCGPGSLFENLCS